MHLGALIGSTLLLGFLLPGRTGCRVCDAAGCLDSLTVSSSNLPPDRRVKVASSRRVS